jgi:hypothetical protein
MSLLNKASLIQIPSGYKDGTLYSAKPTNGDGDFTFSRGSNLAATRVNSEGLIEKGRENLLLQSNSFDTTWTKSSGITLTSGQSGYDGSNNAWLVERSAAYNNLSQSNSSFFTPISTVSVYAKSGTYNFLRLAVAGVQEQVYFNLTDGSVGVNTELIAYSTQSVGNGWWRVSATFQDSSASGIYIQPVETDGGVGNAGTGNILIQDAQLEVGLVSTDVITTTTTTEQAGILEDMPRLDYSGGATCGHLLLEPQRSNTIGQSEYFGQQQISSSANLEINTTTSPQGIQNASTLTSNTSSSAVKFLNFAGVQAGASDDAVFSLFVKKYNHKYIQLINNGDNDLYANFDVEDGVVGNVGSQTTASIEDYGNGWYRCSIILDGSQNINANQRIYLADSLTQSYASASDVASGNGVYVWGSMQENNASYVSSYIPTYGSSVTRSQDTSINYNNANLPTAYPFSLFAEINVVDTGSGYAITLLDSSVSNFYYTIEYFSNVWHITSRPSGSTNRVSSTTAITLGTHKLLGIYTDTTMTLYLDGTSIASGSNSQSFHSTINDLLLGQLRTVSDTGSRNSIKEAIVFNTELSSAEAIELTTI